MGGTDDPNNLIELSIIDHAAAHKKLYEEYGKWEDFLAWQGLLGIIPSKEMHSEATKLGMKQWWNNLTEQEQNDWKIKCKSRPENYIYPSGYTYSHTEEAKKKIGAAHKGKIVSLETRKKIVENRNHAKGERNGMSNPENRKKVSMSKIGRKRVYMEDGTFKYIRMG